MIYPTRSSRLNSCGKADQRGQLGKIRRLTARLHRHFAPEHRALQALAQRLPIWFNDQDRAAFLETVDEFSLAFHDLDAIQERAKLLQEELAARVAEEINHSLFQTVDRHDGFPTHDVDHRYLRHECRRTPWIRRQIRIPLGYAYYGRRGFSHVIDPSLEAVVLTFMPPDGESSKPRTIRRNTLAALLPTPFREAVPQDGQTVFIQL